MKYSQKYTLVAFIEPIKVGTEFEMEDWPVHITLADVFAIELNTGVQQRLTGLLAHQSQVSLSVGEDATLGTTRVALINKNNELQNLHDEIINILELYGVEFNTPEFTRKGFLPHSTIQKSRRLNTEDKIEINTISLIDMFPDSNWRQRKLLNNFKLSEA